jgi:hypothetical protein
MKCGADKWVMDMLEDYKCAGKAEWEELRESNPDAPAHKNAEERQLELQRIANPWFRAQGNHDLWRLGWNPSLQMYEAWDLNTASAVGSAEFPRGKPAKGPEA